MIYQSSECQQRAKITFGNPYEIIKDFQYIEILGRGAYGIVIKVWDKNSK